MTQNAVTQYIQILSEMRNTHRKESYSLPGSCYIDQSVYDAERVWLRNEWYCVGRADQVSQPGEYFTTTLFDEPLLTVRGDDGLLRVFANVCRHRNMQVAKGCGKSKLFVCPFHAWSCLLYTSPSPRDATLSRMPSSA